MEQVLLEPVYPRWRGEHGAELDKILGESGLSPLARGTPGYSWEYQTLTRFIPAGAGNTTRGSIMTAALPVYPRWRGEHGAGPRQEGSTVGLSPLARGTLNLLI